MNMCVLIAQRSFAITPRWRLMKRGRPNANYTTFDFPPSSLAIRIPRTSLDTLPFGLMSLGPCHRAIVSRNSGVAKLHVLIRRPPCKLYIPACSIPVFPRSRPIAEFVPCLWSAVGQLIAPPATVKRLSCVCVPSPGFRPYANSSRSLPPLARDVFT